MPLKKSITTRDVLFCCASIALSLTTLLQTQQLAVSSSKTPSKMEGLLEACTTSSSSSTAFVQDYPQYHGFFDTGSPILNPLVCVWTQVLYELVEETPRSVGYLVVMTTAMTVFPLAIQQILEAGRRDARLLLLRVPLLVLIMNQVVAPGVVIPLLWLPSYIFGRGLGGVSTLCLFLSIIVTLPPLLITGLSFVQNTKTELWNQMAAFAVGPGSPIVMGSVASVTLALTKSWMAPLPTDIPAAVQSAQRATLPLGFAGIICLLLWLWMLFLVVLPEFGNFGGDPNDTSKPFFLIDLYHVLWGKESSAVVRFMVVNGTSTWLSGLLLIAYHKPIAILEAIGLTVIFGPGAALALVLAGLQLHDLTTHLANKTKKNKRA